MNQDLPHPPKSIGLCGVASNDAEYMTVYTYRNTYIDVHANLFKELCQDVKLPLQS